MINININSNKGYGFWKKLKHLIPYENIEKDVVINSTIHLTPNTTYSTLGGIKSKKGRIEIGYEVHKTQILLFVSFTRASDKEVIKRYVGTVKHGEGFRVTIQRINTKSRFEVTLENGVKCLGINFNCSYDFKGLFWIILPTIDHGWIHELLVNTTIDNK